MTHYLEVSSEKTQSRHTADELLLHTTLDKALDTPLVPRLYFYKRHKLDQARRVQEVGSEICLHDQWQTRANSLC